MPSSPTGGLRAASLAALLVAAPLTVQASPSASAASTAPSARPDPTRVDAPVPLLQHRSALQAYRRHAEQPLGDWRAANDEVARIGGWRAYLREAHAPEAPAAPDTPRAGGPTTGGVPTPATAPGHGHHGGRR